MENQREKSMDNDMGTAALHGLYSDLEKLELSCCEMEIQQLERVPNLW